MVFYYPLEYNLMEITDSLATDIKDAPDWFHSAISQSPRKENLNHPLGNVAYQVWDRKDAQDIIILIHSTVTSQIQGSLKVIVVRRYNYRH